MLWRVVAFCVIVPLGLGAPLLGSEDPVITAVGFAAYAAVGGLVLMRRDGHPTGWLLLLVGLAITTADAVVGAGNGPSDTVGVWVESWIWSGVFALFILLILTFPSGNLAGHGRFGGLTRATVWSLPFLLAAQAFTVDMSGSESTFTVPNPIGFLPNWLGGLAYLMTALLLFAAVISLAVRRSRATGVERLQFTCVVFAAVLLIVAVGIGMALSVFVLAEGQGSDWVWIPTFLLMMLFPISFGVAILRYRLYEIDHIVSRTVSYSVVVGLLGAVFLAVVSALSTLLPPASDLTIAASTLTVAVLFNPLRRRVQEGVDRRFNRRRHDAQLVSERFTAALPARTDRTEIVGSWVGVVDQVLAPSAIAVWLRGG